MEKLIYVHPYLSVDGTRVYGVSKIDFENNIVTCFDPNMTDTFSKREINGLICFFIPDDSTYPDHHYCFSDDTNIFTTNDQGSFVTCK